VDGVQLAELQLNPADMGPVAVQIVVDGSQAQVSFHAVQAETRQALEQSLPDLAAALQSQGLTLSGGGVFQQAQRDADHGESDSGSGNTARSPRGGSDRMGATASAGAAPVRRSVGLLDTFA
jgi:flagellar hook-length control protein FliK